MSEIMDSLETTLKNLDYLLVNGSRKISFFGKPGKIGGVYVSENYEEISVGLVNFMDGLMPGVSELRYKDIVSGPSINLGQLPKNKIFDAVITYSSCAEERNYDFRLHTNMVREFLKRSLISD